MTRFDVAIIGAGMAGASLAAELSGECSVLLLEAEEFPGYHSTGRSAAFWSETYGGPAIQPLTTASRAFLATPPDEFSEKGFLIPRGSLHIGTAESEGEAAAMLADFADSPVLLDRVEPSEIDRYLSGRRDGWDVALWEPDCCDIDVAGLHQAYLRAASANGCKPLCRARVRSLSYRDGRWLIETEAGPFEATVIVNAAGAWADTIAQMAGVRPLGIQPYRRTVVQLQVSPAAPADLPLVVGLDGSFYFKPEAGGRLWLSPHDEIETPPCDAAPEELDVATAIARFEEVVDWKIERLERKWAGLRSFAPDRKPVIGRDAAVENFFWLAGQGGFGIQTAPAVAKLAADVLLDRKTDPKLDAAQYLPERFR